MLHGQALLLTGVLAAGSAVTASPWLMAVAVAFAAVAIRRTTTALRRRGEGS